jgi:hypothetical protein
MKNLVTLLLVTLLSTAVLAGDASLNGYWRSDSGASINVCYAGNPDTFTLVVNGNQNYTATWMSGFRTQFYYYAGNDRIYGVYDPSRDVISLSNEAGSWSSTWRR